MEKYTIIHNPRCSKSRETLKLLESHGVSIEVIDYLNGGLNRALLETIIKSLQVAPKELLRTKEERFTELNLDLDDSNQVIEALLNHPKLLERPIVMRGGQAVIGRPPENVMKLILS